MVSGSLVICWKASCRMSKNTSKVFIKIYNVIEWCYYSLYFTGF